MRWVQKLASLAAVTAIALLAAAPAGAVSTIRSPNPPQYKVEIEPHGILQSDIFYNEGHQGIGVGGRFSIPVMSPGFIKSINDSIAISFGPDFVYFDQYRYYCNGVQCAGSSFWRMYFPVTMQWNFWLTDKWSVFGEPGLVIRHDFADICAAGYACNVRTVDPAFFAGARWHFSERAALTMRVGFPEAISVGVSFF